MRMQPICRGFVPVLAIALGWLAAPARADHPNGSVMRGELARRLDGYLTHAADWGFSGAVLIAKNNRIVLSKGYGFANREKKLAFTPDTPSCIGSITKQFTAAAILKLEMEKKLSTDDPIARHLPRVPADKAGVTIYHLLTHTGGFPEYSGDDYDKALRDDTVRRILATPLAFKPGTQFSYSNAGYSVLAAIVERVSGQSYESYLHDHFFQPAGMEHTGYRTPHWNTEALPHSYTGTIDHGSSLDHAWSPEGPYWNLLGNGGILSTVGDMYRWRQALQGDSVLSAAARKKLFTPVSHNYACGWEVRQTPHGRRIGHGGANDLGFNAIVGWYDSGETLIVLCNSGTYDNNGEQSGVIGFRLTELLFGGGLPSFPRAAFVDTPATTLKSYQGQYELSSGGTVGVALHDGQLVLEPIGQEAVALLALAPEEIAPFGDLSKRAGVIVSALLQGDRHPFAESARNANAGKVLGGVLENRLKGWEKSDGPIQRATIVGTVASWWDGQGTPVTVVHVVLKNMTRVFRFHWENGKIAGIGGAVIRNPAATPLRATGPGEFVGWHLAIARPVVVRFNTAGSAAEAGLTLVVDGHAISARKKEH